MTKQHLKRYLSLSTKLLKKAFDNDFLFQEASYDLAFDVFFCHSVVLDKFLYTLL